MDRVQRYDRVAIAFHWLIALLIISNWPIGYFGEGIEERIGVSLVPLHKSLGLTVLALSIARLGWRLAHPPPPLPASISRLRLAVARVTHWTFYLLMIAVPITGCMRVSSGRYPLEWFGLIELPKFAIERGSAQAALASEAHGRLAWAMLALLVLHVAAALHHHHRLRDALFLRMIPARRRRAASRR